MAIAIPVVGLPVDNLFLSHNFEINYGLPTNASHWRVWYDNFGPSQNRVKREEKNGRFLTRRFIYEMVNDKMNA